MATQIQEGELDCTNASRGVWLVKVPKYISQRWDKAPGNIEVGKLRIARTPSGQKSGQSGRPKLDVSFSLSEAVLAMEKSEAIPKDHKFVISNVNNQTLGVFSQTTPPANSNAVVPETEKLMMEGRVIQRAECKPEGSETYMKLKLEGFRKSAVPARMAKRLDDVVHVKPVANHRYNVEFTQKKKSEGKKVRDDKDKVMNVLFAAFEKHQYYNIKDLAGITRQPV
ncbi:general transcription factor IIF subunit 2-like, partial [Amphibalanus amphitrite]